MNRMYLKHYSDNAILYLKKHTYKNIFNREFNIGFFSHKIDQRAVCEEHNDLTTKSEDLINKFEKLYKLNRFYKT